MGSINRDRKGKQSTSQCPTGTICIFPEQAGDEQKPTNQFNIRGIEGGTPDKPLG